MMRWMSPQRLNRREMLHRCASSGLLLASGPLTLSLAETFAQTESNLNRKPTPPNEIGPFYRRGAPANSNLRLPNDPGFPLKVEGIVVDARGEVRPDAVVEVWQANHRGKYDLETYRYRAVLETNSKGAYGFESVLPGHYSDRVAQHIHYLVRAPGCRPLVTQLYFATDPAFEGDPDRNYTRDPLVLSRELVRPVILSNDPAGVVAQVRFEICLERL